VQQALWTQICEWAFSAWPTSLKVIVSRSVASSKSGQCVSPCFLWGAAAQRLRCSSCLSRPVDVLPDWRECIRPGAASTIAAASVIGAEGRLDRRGQILAARELSSDRLKDLLDLGVRLGRPLMADSRVCFGRLETVFRLGQFFGFLRQLSTTDI